MSQPAFSAVQARATDWFSQRSPRERALLAGLATLAMIFVFVSAIWTPMQASRAAARADIRTYDNLTARLRAAGPDLAARPRALAGSAPTVITMTAAEAGLTIQRLEPEGGLTRVAMEDAPFDKLVRWLDRLESEGGLRLMEIKLDRRPGPGSVNVQMALAHQ